MLLRRLLPLWLTFVAAGFGLPQSEGAAMADALFQQAQGRMAGKRWNEAEVDFGKCYALEPERFRCVQGQAYAMELQGRRAEALVALQQAAGKVREQFDLHMSTGLLAGRAKNYDLALREFEVLSKMPGLEKQVMGEIYRQIGEAYRGKEEPAKAIGYYLRAKALLPSSAGTMLGLAQALDDAGKKKEAVGEYRAVLDIDSSNVGALNNLAYLLAEDGGDSNEALAHAFHARQLAPEMPEVKDTLGWVYFKRGSLDAALVLLREAVRDTKASASASALYHYHLAMVLEKKGDRDGALVEATAALNIKDTPIAEKRIKALLERLQSGGKP